MGSATPDSGLGGNNARAVKRLGWVLAFFCNEA